MNEIELMNKNKKLMCLNVEYNLNKMNLYSAEGTYDFITVPKLINKFKRINKNSYYDLYDFMSHISNCKKYYQCENCRKFSTEICISIKRFIDSYYQFLS